MSPGFTLVYFGVSFLVGVACLGIAVVLARRPSDPLARAYVVFYAALTLLVTAKLLLTISQMVPDLFGPMWPERFNYAESFLGRYAVMFGLPYFAHRLFAVDEPARDRWILGLVMVAFMAQHVTEFGFGDTVDEAGDVAEDILFALIAIYSIALGFRPGAKARAFGAGWPGSLLVVVLLLPGGVYDLFYSDGGVMRFYPLFYIAFSIALTRYLMVTAEGRLARDPIPDHWSLSEREVEVAGLIGQGLSNRDIANRLSISQNTVKTHVRSIFEKSGVRSRFGLMAALSAGPITRLGEQNHPDGR